ncbi:PAS domain S-box protein [Waterburya agarophytonicola K14]|uniref:PAS domain S-box protein n=1 Tax=Waterburya agarophytonicola KI4 TaxID=2874699 RepID=A0A964BQ63_9CYAN|nr:PAS domain S-box protein [Waterburya agarophytonicola]MCC0176312.1 PAS domain S-box protein [Waterburya agarophytonicola KI4]
MVKQKFDPLVTSDKSQKYHRALWDNSPTPQAVYEFDGTILDANQAFATLIGRNIIETLGLNIWAITPQEYHYKQPIEQARLEQEGSFTIERAYLDSTGKRVPVRLSAVKLELEGNSLVLLNATKISSSTTVEVRNSQSTQQIQEVLDKLPMAVFWKDRDSVFLGCNQVLADVAGLASPEEIIGKTDYDLPWKKEEADWFRECDRRIIESEKPEHNIIESQKQADGGEKWLKTNKFLLRDSQNKVIGIAGTFEDITERVELEKQLAEQAQNLESLIVKRTEELIASKARFEKLVTNVPGAIYQFKLHTTGKFSFPYISSDCEEILEYTSEQIIQNSELVISLICQEDISNFEQVVSHSAQTLKPKHWEGRIVTPSGKKKWIQTASKPEKQGDGSIIWDGLMTDISDRKQSERELRESQQLLHLIFDTLPQRIFWKDTNFNYLGCNKLFASDTGLSSPEEVVGKNDFELSWHKSAHLYRADDEVIMAGGSPKINYEESQIRDDGTILTIKTSKLPLKDKNGRTIGLFGCYEDISTISQQQQKTEKAQDFLAKAIDSIRNPIFVKDTNHRWVLINDAYCDFLGYSKEEMLGKSEPDFYAPEEADIYWAKDELVMLSGGRETEEEPFTDRDGNEKIIVTQKSCFQDLDGNNYLLGMIIDIYDA